MQEPPQIKKQIVNLAEYFLNTKNTEVAKYFSAKLLEYKGKDVASKTIMGQLLKIHILLGSILVAKNLTAKQWNSYRSRLKNDAGISYELPYKSAEFRQIYNLVENSREEVCIKVVAAFFHLIQLLEIDLGKLPYYEPDNTLNALKGRIYSFAVSTYYEKEHNKAKAVLQVINCLNMVYMAHIEKDEKKLKDELIEFEKNLCPLMYTHLFKNIEGFEERATSTTQLFASMILYNELAA